MGCGDTFTDIATGGATAIIDDPGVTQAIGGVMTGGATNAMNGDIVGALSGGASSSMGTGEIGKLTRASIEGLVTGGVSNIQQAAKYKNFANQLDVFFDPSRMNDKWIRKSGTYLEGLPLGHEARQLAPQVMSTVGGIIGAVTPITPMGGAAAGYYLGNKIKGDSNEAGLKGAAISAAAAGIGSGANEYIKPIVSGALGGGITGAIGSGVVSGATTGAAAGAMGAAANGGDMAQGAGMGALTGGIGGGVGAGLNQTYQAAGVPQTYQQPLSSLANMGLKYGTTALNQDIWGTPIRPQTRPQQQGPQLTPQQQATMAALFGGR